MGKKLRYKKGGLSAGPAESSRVWQNKIRIEIRIQIRKVSQAVWSDGKNRRNCL